MASACRRQHAPVEEDPPHLDRNLGEGGVEEDHRAGFDDLAAAWLRVREDAAALAGAGVGDDDVEVAECMRRLSLGTPCEASSGVAPVALPLVVCPRRQEKEPPEGGSFRSVAAQLPEPAAPVSGQDRGRRAARNAADGVDDSRRRSRCGAASLRGARR
jgi:hypothetical protein